MSSLGEIAQHQYANALSQKEYLRQSDAYKFLNAKQFEAVSAPLKSFLVLAGAGTGKTSVLINRMRYLIEELGVAPKSIMAVTFTNKAAKEIRSRLFHAFKNTPEKANEPTIGTFHSVCFRFVREYARHIGLAENYMIWDEDDIKDYLVSFVSMGYDRPESLMTNEERQFALANPFIRPVEQVSILKVALSNAIDVLDAEYQLAASNSPEMQRSAAEVSQMQAKRERIFGLQNALDYFAFFADAMSGKKTIEYEGKRIHIGNAIHKEISTFKESGFKSSNANEKYKSYFAAYYDDVVKHYVPKFMLDDFEIRKAIRYLALIVYKDYELYCKDNHLLDFSDLLLLSVKLLEENELIRKKIQREYKAILVDEFQDTNMMQYRWLKLLAGEDNAFMVVGDDDQSIYGWRGACPEYMEYFLYDFQHPLAYDYSESTLQTIEERKRKVPRLDVVKLEQNYRSTANILTAANEMINLNTDRLGKTLYTKNTTKNDFVRVAKFSDQNVEAEFIAFDIKRLIAESIEKHKQDPNAELLGFGDFAILYRNNQLGSLASSVLVKNNVPHTVYGGYNFYQRKEVKNGLYWLQFMLDLENDVLFTKTYNQIPPTKRVNPFATGKADRAFSTKMIELLEAEKKRSKIPRLIDALISISTRYNNERAVLNNDFSQVGPDVDSSWVSPYATTIGFITSEFHHNEKDRIAAKIISDYAEYLYSVLDVMTNDKLTLTQAVEMIWQRCGYWQFYENNALEEKNKEDTQNAEKKGKSTNAKKVIEAQKEFGFVKDLFGFIGTWESDQQTINQNYANLTLEEKLAAFINDVALLTDVESNRKLEQVKLMTIHGSKGLEFKRVYLIGVSSGVLPTVEDSDEERRLFYVGITRAREHLTVSAAGRKSVFMDELESYCFSFIDDLGYINDLEFARMKESVSLNLDSMLEHKLDKPATGIESLQKSDAKRIERTNNKAEKYGKGNTGRTKQSSMIGSFDF